MRQFEVDEQDNGDRCYSASDGVNPSLPIASLRQLRIPKATSHISLSLPSGWRVNRKRGAGKRWGQG